MKNITSEQMEFGAKNATVITVNVRQQRRARARWWFWKMRQVVDLAMPPQPIGSPRPEQTYLRLAPLVRHGR